MQFVATPMKGKTSGRLRVLRRGGKSADGDALWLCRRTCGKTAEVAGKNIRKKLTRSCGCLRRELARARVLAHNPRLGREVV